MSRYVTVECDRCKTTFPFGDTVLVVKDGKAQKTSDVLVNTHTHELCARCGAEYRNFMQGGSVKAVHDRKEEA